MHAISHSLVLLLILCADLYNLENVVVGVELYGANVDLYVIPEEVLCQVLHFLRPGGAPH